VNGRRIVGPFGLAVVITLVNALKPVVVDDAAYLAFARHIAAAPLDPYGFTLHWYTFPDRGMDVLLPPVLPYWLAIGIGLFGEHLLPLKLWLFPILWCFTKSLDVLLRRFAKGSERLLLPMIALGPAILPTVNFMLDVPAAALGLAALAVFTRRAATWRSALLAGLFAGIAMQTKYTAMLAPAAILWYGLTHRRLGAATVAATLAAVVFAGWEAILFAKYGESHFLHHLAEQRAGSGNWLLEKSALIPGLVGHLGLLGFAVSLAAGIALGLPRRAQIVVAITWCVGVGLVCTLPDESFRGRNVWRPAGCAALLAAAATTAVMLFKRTGLRRSRDAWFLTGWLLIELAGYFVLTPFPAARRVIGLAIVLGMLAARAISRRQRLESGWTPPRWLGRFAIGIGVAVAALDTIDARIEPRYAERGLMVAKGKGATRILFAGHWGFQYPCEIAGAEQVVPGRTVFEPGDALVLPLIPDDRPIHRPHIGLVRIEPPAERVIELARFTWRDPLPRTIPNFYGGNDPLANHAGPKLDVAVYRFTRTWAVPEK